jgi:hypothetical protein
VWAMESASAMFRQVLESVVYFPWTIPYLEPSRNVPIWAAQFRSDTRSLHAVLLPDPMPPHTPSILSDDGPLSASDWLGMAAIETKDRRGIDRKCKDEARSVQAELNAGDAIKRLLRTLRIHISCRHGELQWDGCMLQMASKV